MSQLGLPSALLPVPPNPAATQLRNDALKDILTVGGVALASGIGIRGLMGLRNFFGREKKDLSRSLGPTVLGVQTPVYSSQEDLQRARRLKAANFFGEATTKQELPFYYPGITLAGIGGLAGGFGLTNWILNNKRKTDLKDELDEARSDYRRALLEQYDPARIPPAGKIQGPLTSLRRLKTAAIGSLGKDLDELADWSEAVGRQVLEKQAGTGGQLLGMYGALASLLALGSGVAMYNHTRARSKNRLLEDAIRARERDRWATRPPEMFAVPTPVHLSRQGALDVPEDATTPKLAALQGMTPTPASTAAAPAPPVAPSAPAPPTPAPVAPPPAGPVPSSPPPAMPAQTGPSGGAGITPGTMTGRGVLV